VEVLGPHHLEREDEGTDKNQQEYVVLSIATKDSWKNDQGEYESRTEWHRVYAWRNPSRFAKTLQKGHLISVDDQVRYREYTEDVNGSTLKHRVAEIHAYKLQRLSKVEGQAEPVEESADE
jgi:single-strand DNA-binding protein